MHRSRACDGLRLDPSVGRGAQSDAGMPLGCGAMHVSTPLAFPQVPERIVGTVVAIERTPPAHRVGRIDPDANRVGCWRPCRERAASLDDERPAGVHALEHTGPVTGPVPPPPAPDVASATPAHERPGDRIARALQAVPARVGVVESHEHRGHAGPVRAKGIREGRLARAAGSVEEHERGPDATGRRECGAYRGRRRLAVAIPGRAGTGRARGIRSRVTTR